MKVLIVSLMLVTLASCGKKSTSSQSDNEVDRQNQDYATDIREVDLLDVAIDVPVEMSPDRITFKKSSQNSANGVRTTCSIKVDSGESYQYRVSGNSLALTLNNGKKLNFKRVSGENGINGSWTSDTKEGNAHVLRRVTFLSDNRMVMRTHCEG